jgi:hypothetical protein
LFHELETSASASHGAAGGGGKKQLQRRQRLHKVLQNLQLRLTRFIVLVKWLSTASSQNHALQVITVGEEL